MVDMGVGNPVLNQFWYQFFLEFRTVFLNLDKVLDKNSCPKKKLGGTFFPKNEKKLLEPVGLLWILTLKKLAAYFFRTPRPDV